MSENNLGANMNKMELYWSDEILNSKEQWLNVSIVTKYNLICI
jgi:hypothetical protein